MIITYTAKRNLTGDHAAGAEYTLDIKIKNFSEQRNRNRVTNNTLDGTSYGVTHYVKKKFTFKTQVLQADLLSQFREFIDSVEYGENFTISDPDSGEIHTVYLDSFTPNRVLRKLNTFQYSLTVITSSGAV